MWKLTVERRYKIDHGFDSSDKIFFEIDDIEELCIVLQYLDKYGKGETTYIIERIDKNGDTEKENEKHEV